MGWTGAIMAKELTDAGLTVVALERGRTAIPSLTSPIRAWWTSWKDRSTASSCKACQRKPSPRARQKDTAVPYRQMGSFKPGTGVGGAGTHWSGCHFRALREDFNLRSNVKHRYGAKFIPDGMTIADFPLSYEDLEPHFDHFEQVCGTSGKAGVLTAPRSPAAIPSKDSLARISVAAQPQLSRRRIILYGGTRDGLQPVSDSGL